MHGFILHNSFYLHITSVVRDLRHLSDNSFLHRYKFIVSYLRVLLFSPLRLVADDWRVWIFYHLYSWISSALVPEIAIWVLWLVFHPQDSSFDDGPMILHVGHDSRPMKPCLICKNPIFQKWYFKKGLFLCGQSWHQFDLLLRWLPLVWFFWAVCFYIHLL